MSRPRPMLALALALLIGCAGDSGDESGGGTSDATTGTATTTSSSSTTATTTATTTTVGSDTTSSSGDTAPTTDASAGSSEASTAAESEGSSGDAGMCPMDPEDDDCRTCVKLHCCGVWETCQANDACACVIDCHLGGGSLGMCQSQCGDDGGAYEAVYFCGQMSCLGTCDWDCC